MKWHEIAFVVAFGIVIHGCSGGTSNNNEIDGGSDNQTPRDAITIGEDTLANSDGTVLADQSVAPVNRSDSALPEADAGVDAPSSLTDAQPVDASASDAPAVDSGTDTPDSDVTVPPEVTVLPDQEIVVSGSRLKARMLQAPGVNLTSYQWYDSVLDLDCSFAEVSDGTARCLPGALVAKPNFYYKSTDCSGTPLLRASADYYMNDWDTCGVPTTQRYVQIQSDGCLSTIAAAQSAPIDSLWTMTGTEAIENGTVLSHFDQDSGTCVAELATTSTNLYTVDEVPIEQFVQAEVITPTQTDGERLGLVDLVTEDGAHQHAGLYDYQREEYCSITRAADGALRCLPRRDIGYLDYLTFSDNKCEQPAAYSYTGSTCGKPKYAKKQEMACGEPTTEIVFSVGAWINVPYHTNLGGCSAYADDRDVYRIDGEIAPAAFAHAIFYAVNSDDRLRSYVLWADMITSPMLGLWDKNIFWDSELSSDCRFRVASDGTTRCMPGKPTYVVYSDEECTSPAGVVKYCNNTADNYVLLQSGGTGTSCDPKVYQVYESGALIGPLTSAYYRMTSKCYKTANSQSYSVYALGNEVTPAALVEGEEVLLDPSNGTTTP